MSFDAKVLKILVASPGDVDEERQAIPEVIYRWNFINSEASKVVLMPVKWETHSAPLMGDRPQGIINEQMIKSCDMAIGCILHATRFTDRQKRKRNRRRD